MAESQLSPEELDRLEDALEDLELGDLIDDVSPRVRARLADYREILIASREALPMQEVPAGLLAGVLAEARADSSDVLGLTPVDEPRTQPESWWSRIRKSFLIPSLAVVTTAALILIFVQPMSNDALMSGEADELASAERSNDEKKTVENMPTATPEPLDLAAELDEAEDETPREELAAGEDVPIVEVATARRSRSAPSSTAEPAAVGGKAARPAGPPPAAADDADKDAKREQKAANWDAIERGDKARMAGDCFTASNAYHRALDDGNDSVRARALAGLGLCATEEGNSAKASTYFKEARGLDPDVGDYIATQSPERDQKPKRPLPRKKAKRKKAEYDAPSDSLAPNARDVQPFKD
jgi:tetratricopeptide (TPR) repeat protein